MKVFAFEVTSLMAITANEMGSTAILHSSNSQRPSALGQNQTSDRRPLMSALPSKADISAQQVGCLLCTNSGHRGDKGSGATLPTGANFKFFSRLFADNVERLFVAAQPKEGGCRISPPLVHSVNFTSPTSLGIIHLRSRPSLAGGSARLCGLLRQSIHLVLH